jgi:3-oxoacyl-[acyl-carrier protein] reductase
MDLELKDKTAIITGASHGLGYACAEALANEGVKVVVSSRNEEKIRAAAKEIANGSGVKVLGVPADLTDEEDLNRLVSEAEKFLEHIDILVVSTGHPPTHRFSIATDEHWEDGFDLLLRPPILLTRLLLKGMQARGYGRIIFIGSIFGLEPEMTSVVQSTLRTGLNALAKCIATEVAADGVTVNVICPGYFDTPLVRDLAKQYATAQQVSIEEILKSWADYSPVKKFGKPEDLGSLVAFLASSRGQFITGTTVTIDGGAVRQY